MSAPSSATKRSGQTSKKQSSLPPQPNGDEILDSVKAAVTSDWDYKIALVIITILAFISRFWGISHPNEVVFDEVHFGKVSAHQTIRLPSPEQPAILFRRGISK